MEKRELIYEGKAKRLFNTENPELVIAEFKDDLTAFNGAKKDSEAGKGALNNKISTELFKMLASKGVESHFVEMIDDNETANWQNVDTTESPAWDLISTE